MIPASYAPRDPPPDNTMPIRGRDGGACTDPIVNATEPVRCCPTHHEAPRRRGGAPVRGVAGGRRDLPGPHRPAVRGRVRHRRRPPGRGRPGRDPSANGEPRTGGGRELLVRPPAR